MNTLRIDLGAAGPTIEPAVHGHFAEHLGRCIYEGLWVGPESPIPNTRGLRNDVVAALRDLQVPVLRWPGGCFADEYHWRDGIGPRSQRKRMINTHWGGGVEDNSFGTHEFLDLCEQIGCEPYVNGNLGSGTVQEMSEWVEYMTFDGDSPLARLRAENGRAEPWKVKWFGVGNESWGCGGNLKPQAYADLYRRYQTFVRNYGANRVHKIACGPNGDDYQWTDVLMREAGAFLDSLTLHHYAVEPNWSDKGPATGFDRAAWLRLLASAARMDELVTRHRTIMDQHDPKARVGLIVDEWGAWHRVEPGTNPGFLYQQNTIRDAVLAGLTLNVFHKHAARVRMANLAQMINVLQSVILTDGPRMVLTPTYHLLKLYRGHQGATALATEVDAEALEVPGGGALPSWSASASRDASGVVRISLVNLDPEAPHTVAATLGGWAVGRSVQGEALIGAGLDDHNTFDAPNRVQVQAFSGWKATASGLEVTLPPRSVVTLTLGS